ncbi:MAG TPA: hypothetical protein V6D07_13190 [Trichocoleus sp.]
MARKDDRLTVPALGEWYSDLLAVDAAINNRTPGQQFQSLGCAKLQEREAKIRERVTYLAQKRGISPDEMWRQLVTGRFTKILPEEWADMPEQSVEQSNSK